MNIIAQVEIFLELLRISDEAMFTLYRQSQESGHAILFIKIYFKKKISTVSNAPFELYLVSQRLRSNNGFFADEQVDISTS